MTRISNLASTETVSQNDVLVVSDGQLTKKITVANLTSSLIKNATRTEPGVVRVGSGLDISSSGVLSVRNFSGYTLPVASSDTLGGIRVGEGLEIDSQGFLRSNFILPLASPSVLGGIRIGEGFVLDNIGTLSVDLSNRNKFNNGLFVGTLDSAGFSVEGNIPTIRDYSNGSINLSVSDNSIGTGVAGLRVLSTIRAAESGGTMPSVISVTGNATASLGTPNRRWKSVYADELYGTVIGSISGNTSGDHKGNVLANDNTIAYNASNKVFTGTLVGTVEGSATTANRLTTPRRINNINFDGSSDITIEDTTKVSKLGDILSGFLTLHSNPTNNMHAATKRYVDQRDAETLSIFGGTMQGFITLNDPPQQNLHAANKSYVDASVSTRLSLLGGELTGPLILNTPPTAIFHATTKQYVDNTISDRLLESITTLRNYVDLRDNTRVPLAGGTMTGFLTLNAEPLTNLHAATKLYVDRGLTDLNVSLRSYVDATTSVKMNRSGDVMTGFLTLHSDPTSNLHAATKQYVDSADTSLTASLRTYIDSRDNTRVPLSGGTMTGHLTLNSNPTANLHAATKQYVDSADISLSNNLRSYVDQLSNARLQLIGGVMLGYLTLHADPDAALHAATKQYVDGTTSNLNATLRAYIDARDNTRVQLAGGVMTGFLTLHANPTANLHAATKQYVDNRIASIPMQNLRITAGANSTVSYSNIVGQWRDDLNFFDVFPPSGKTMSNLLGFIPSIRYIAFAGGVNADDSMKCVYTFLSDRIRVNVQNTEQRDRPQANWLAIWS
jgi:hypothetical protein